MSGMSPDDHESYQLAGLAGLYALDALEGDELRRFEALLATSPELQEEVAGFRATAARLGDVSAAAPPPSMRADVLAAVATTRQEAPVVSLSARRDQRLRQRALLAVAAAILVVVAGVGGYVVADRRQEPTSELASLLARSDTRVVPLVGTADESDVSGRVVVSPSAGQVVIVSDDIAAPAEGRTYEVWRMGPDGGVDSAGLFEPDADGRVEVTLPVDVDGATAFLVTDEPDGGSPQPTAPTTPPILQASLE